MKIGDTITHVSGAKFELKKVGIIICVGYYLDINNNRIKDGFNVNGGVSYCVGLFNIKNIVIDKNSKEIDPNQLDIFDCGA